MKSAKILPLRSPVPLPRPVKAYGPDLAGVAWQALYYLGRENLCPGCGRSHWTVGRVTAECGFCKTVLPLSTNGADQA